MFSKSSKKTDDTTAVQQTPAPVAESAPAPVPAGAYKTTISSGSVLNGELDVDTDLHVDGKVKGRLKIGKKFVIGKEGHVTSEGIECAVAEVSGSLEGPITATEMLTIHAGGHIKGDISVRDVIIEKGGRLDGRCQYLTPESAHEVKPATPRTNGSAAVPGASQTNKGEGAARL